MCVPEQDYCEKQLISGECHSCNIGYIKITENSNIKCIEEINNCETYDFATELCIDCVDN
jgi:hypothetical protein